jgi:hypothetical protein
MNPRLSDFSYEQITIAYKGLCAHKIEIQEHIAGLRKAELVARMFENEILQYETELESLEQVIIQFAWMWVQKKKEAIVASN